ncbi:MAG TPA: cytochrome P450 [Methylocella sp.]|nr:cytochrome P450 [Methylocella sp.]
MNKTHRCSGPLRPPAPAPLDAPLGPIASLRAMRRNALETYTKAHFEMPVLTGPSILGPTAVINDPAAIRRVLVDNSANYCKDSLQKRLLGPSLRDGLLEAEGSDWRFQRRTLAPLLTPKTVSAFAQAVNDSAETFVRRMERQCGQTVDIQTEMARVTLEVLGRTIFSDGLGRGVDEVASAMSRLLATVGRPDPLDILGLPDWLPRLTRLAARPAESFFASLVDTLIARRRRLLARDPSAVPQDILTLLLEARDPQTGAGLSKKQIEANIRTFIAAGHETTANALTWSLFLLSLSDEWREIVAEEADEVLSGPVEDYAARLVAARAVIEESMRLYPPAPSMSRQALGPDELAGKRIRKGTLILIVQWVLHRHRGLWEEPDCFDPRRFLPGPREKIDRYVYLPFGAGPRVCIGASFSMQEAVIILAHIARAFTFELKKGHKIMPVQRITLRPKDGMPMIVRRREPSRSPALPRSGIIRSVSSSPQKSG